MRSPYDILRKPRITEKGSLMAEAAPTVIFEVPLDANKSEIENAVRGLVRRHPGEPSLCTVFVRHTSASLVVQENADPSARRDLEAWLHRLVKPGDALFTHTSEGPDDMPSHIRAALTATSLGIPVLGRRMCLGTWQGIYLWEHREKPHERTVVVHVG